MDHRAGRSTPSLGDRPRRHQPAVAEADGAIGDDQRQILVQSRVLKPVIHDDDAGPGCGCALGPRQPVACHPAGRRPGQQHEQHEHALRLAQVAQHVRDLFQVSRAAQFGDELDRRAGRTRVGGRHAHRHQPDDQAVGTEAVGAQVAGDDDRREHAQHVLGVHAHRREERVAERARAVVHARARRTFTVRYSPITPITA